MKLRHLAHGLLLVTVVAVVSSCSSSTPATVTVTSTAAPAAPVTVTSEKITTVTVATTSVETGTATTVTVTKAATLDANQLYCANFEKALTYLDAVEKQYAGDPAGTVTFMAKIVAEAQTTMDTIGMIYLKGSIDPQFSELKTEMGLEVAQLQAAAQSGSESDGLNAVLGYSMLASNIRDTCKSVK